MFVEVGRLVCVFFLVFQTCKLIRKGCERRTRRTQSERVCGLLVCLLFQTLPRGRYRWKCDAWSNALCLHRQKRPQTFRWKSRGQCHPVAVTLFRLVGRLQQTARAIFKLIDGPQGKRVSFVGTRALCSQVDWGSFIPSFPFSYQLGHIIF